MAELIGFSALPRNDIFFVHCLVLSISVFNRAACATSLLCRVRARNRRRGKSSPSVLPVNLRFLVEMANWRNDFSPQISLIYTDYLRELRADMLFPFFMVLKSVLIGEICGLSLQTANSSKALLAVLVMCL